jgi:hypothetical protein
MPTVKDKFISTANSGLEPDFRSFGIFPRIFGQILCRTQIFVRRWFLAKNKNADARCGFRDHSGCKNNIALAT